MTTIETITYSEACERFDAMLEDCYGPVNICGLTYSAAYALKEIDPVAYSCGVADYISSCDEELDIVD
jgi:hypothetical protein